MAYVSVMVVIHLVRMRNTKLITYNCFFLRTWHWWLCTKCSTTVDSVPHHVTLVSLMCTSLSTIDCGTYLKVSVAVVWLARL